MRALELATPPAAPPPDATRRRAPWSWLVLGIAALAVAGGVYWKRQQKDPLADLEVSAARIGEIEESVTALGKIEPRAYVDIGAQVSGQLMRLAVAAGDKVQEGTLLAEIDPQLQVAKLEADRAQLAQLEAERAVQALTVELATAQFERQVRMKQDGTTRDDVFEQKRSDKLIAAAKLTAIDAQIRQMRSTIKADEAQLGFTRIFAPMDGTVLSVDAKPGQTLIAVQQVPVLMRLADLSSMTVWAQVSEADIARLSPGMEVYFTTLGHPGRKWHAKLRQLLPAPYKPSSTSTAAPAGNVVQYTALFDVDNANGELRPEMSAQVFFVVARARDAVIIPATAVKPRKHEKSEAEATVTVVTASRTLEPRDVGLGVRNRFDVQVLEGLEAGERVVTRAATDAAPKAERP